LGSDDPCIDNGEYCDGVEYCQEDAESYLCVSTGVPCDLFNCGDEFDGVCEGSDITLRIADAYGYAGKIDIELENPFDYISEAHVDVCDVDQRAWLHIDTSSCSTTDRSSGFNCVISDLGDGCVRIDLTVVSNFIAPGTGSIAQLNYTLDTDASLVDFADLNPQNIILLCDTHPYTFEPHTASLSVTPKPGKVGVDGCEVAIIPSSETVYSGESIQFSSSNLCYSNLPSFTWEVTSSIGSTINANGLYTAGTNSTPKDVVDTVTLITEKVDGLITVTAKVKVKRLISLEILPSELLRSRWRSLPGLITIKGTGANFELFKTRVDYDTTSVLQLPPLVVPPEHIWQIILILPSWATDIWEDEIDVTVTVTTDSEVVEDSFDIKMLPAPFDEEKNLI